MVGEVIRWDQFLPKRSLRVLLVENDDSTRHVVAALLRKCSYFVSAVADGVKAWEVLKGKQYKFDLVLSEVDMPSLSGIDFLSKVTGCDLSRNIPVIMMSSQDSVNVVFKCMLQGAVDFLVKPVRKNELQNLWQHVWRKHSSSNSISPVEGIDDSQAKSQDVSPKYITVDHEDAESASKNKDNRGDVGDTQSSKSKSDFGTIDGQKPEQLSATEIKNFSKELAKDVDGEAKPKKIVQECALQENCPGISESNKLSQRNRSLSINEEISGSFGSSKSSHTVPSIQSVEVIDFIGAVSGGHKSAALDKDASVIEKNIAIISLPSQDLSPGRQGLIGFPKIDFRERHILKPSAASAFSRYGKATCNSGKRSGAPPATLCTSPKKPTDITPLVASDKEKVFSFSAWSSAQSADPETEKLRNDQVISATVNDGDNFKTHAPGSAGHSESPIEQHRSHHSSNEVNQNGMTLHPGQLELMPFPFPAGSIPIQSLYAGYGAVNQPLLYTEASPSGPTAVQAVKEVASGRHCQKGNHSSYDPSSQQNHVMYSLEVDRTNCAVCKEQEEPEIFMHNEVGQMDWHSHFNVDISGSGAIMSGDITDYHCNMAMFTHQGEESRFQTINGNGLEHGRSYREAALMKFRLKRKDRCFEKKVRYHSRKMLAEQRPRIKGQFVRQATLQSTIAIAGEDDWQ